MPSITVIVRLIPKNTNVRFEFLMKLIVALILSDVSES